jgi:stage II sporulation protein E
MVAQLQRAQEQLRSLKAARERLGEYRSAVVQQYQFLGSYLQELSDRLSRRGKEPKINFQVKVEVYSNRPQEDNGDRCAWFAGTEGRYYVLLCDGMGTGLGAVSEGGEAVRMLDAMLSAGFPAEHALRSLNSLCALRERAGAVTVDLVQLALDSGKAYLYKWGAAPSYVISNSGVEKVGSRGVPPGLSVSWEQEVTSRLTMRTEQILLLVSDGLGEEQVLQYCRERREQTAEAMARGLLASARQTGEDDATVVTVRLVPAGQ